eukprot:CAMPEP_0197633320 /NCGR_PEP_ID=MMETSP1338-20131121/9704_1 /TAXON_ID=43686 ORGANISM="Pelagodinium beii, Strain RCC1491" /NCGR_SAMPLE_ID=MMETSP1338 /ASSEMBLY_ACC=CAM_ASM_000754 /LENGTH=926 /DNA_ID=CAMNT_0043204959 /DNA_START=138 /DNA_END=2918 /DNA_ORIENTATION=-
MEDPPRSRSSVNLQRRPLTSSSSRLSRPTSQEVRLHPVRRCASCSRSQSPFRPEDGHARASRPQSAYVDNVSMMTLSTSSMSLKSRSRRRPGTSSTSRPQSRRLGASARKLPAIDRSRSTLNFDEIFRMSYNRAAKYRASTRLGAELLEQSIDSFDESLPGQNASPVKRSPKSTMKKQRPLLRSVKALRVMDIEEQVPEPVEEKPIEKPLEPEVSAELEDISANEELAELLTPPDKKEVLHRLSGAEFTDREMIRLQRAFKQNSTDSEVHTDDLLAVLDFLGYLTVSKTDCQDLVDGLTEYATVSFDEFLQFMYKVNELESKHFHQSFDSFDDDGSGELSVTEMERVLKSMGITPFRSTIAAALTMVDEDQTGTVSFEEFVQLLMIYRKTEGFSQSEVQKLFRVFSRFADKVEGRHVLHTSKLQDALLNMFGTQVSQLASKLATEKLSTGNSRPVSGIRRKTPAKQPEILSSTGELEISKGMRFREFVVWARRLREAEVDSYKEEFTQHDADGGGVLDPEEIRAVLSSLGYTPLKAVVYDLISAFDSGGDGNLDFDEFVNMMQLFRSTDGFTRTELEDLKEVFKQFDSKNDGEIDVIHMGAMLRSLGFETEHSKAESMLRTVDWNGSNSLDFSEFLRLMRMHREEGLTQVQQVFNEYKDASYDGGLDPRLVSDILIKLGYPRSTSKAIVGVFQSLCGSSVDFDGLVGVVDGCRRVIIRKHRKNAGFSANKLNEFRKQWSNLDRDNSGELQAEELVEFCAVRGLKLETKEDQLYLVDLIQQARNAARETGIPQDECGPKGSSKVTWAVFVHLQRVIQTHEDRKAAVLAQAEQGHQYTKVELDTFREIFNYAVKRQEQEALAGSGVLELEGLWPLFRRMGIYLMPVHKDAIKMRLFKDNKGQTDSVHFDSFIRLAWWIEKSDLFKPGH